MCEVRECAGTAMVTRETQRAASRHVGCSLFCESDRRDRSALRALAACVVAAMMSIASVVSLVGCGGSTRPPPSDGFSDHAGSRSRELLADRTEMERFMQLESFRREAAGLLSRELPSPSRVVFESGRAEPNTQEADSVLRRASRANLDMLPIGPHSDRVQAAAELERVPGRAGASPGIRFVEVSGPFERAQLLVNFDPYADDPPRPTTGRYVVRIVRENADVFTFVADDARRALTAGQTRRWGSGVLTIDYEFRDGLTASRVVRAFEFGFLAGSDPLPWR